MKLNSYHVIVRRTFEDMIEVGAENEAEAEAAPRPGHPSRHPPARTRDLGTLSASGEAFHKTM